MWSLAPPLFVAHALAMLADEAVYHRRRGLPRWERWGHPADTLTVLGCYAMILFLDPAPGNLVAYAGLAAFSALFVTKDEWVHAGRCGGGEMWLHAFLFVLHPVLLFLAGAWWRLAGTPLWDGPERGAFGTFLVVQAGLTLAFLLWQILYWNGPWAPTLPAAE